MQEKTTCLLERRWARWQMPAFRKAVITGLLCEPVWSDLRRKLRFFKYVDTLENGFEVYAHAEEPLRDIAWRKLFPGAKVQTVTGSWEDNSRYRMLHAQGLFITLGTPQRKEVVSDRRKDMTLGKPLRDEGSSGSDDERESKRLHQQLDAPNEDEQRAEAAKSAEVRAARVVMAEAEVVARAADLKLVTVRKDMQYGKGVSSSEQSVLEESVRQARADAAVAKAREDLLRAELKALQLRRA